MSTRNRLRELRSQCGIAAAALARMAGVRRQTVYAIEAGSYVPNTAVALRLARALEVPVEAIFSLDREPPPRERLVDVEILSPHPSSDPAPAVRLAAVGSKLMAVPAARMSLLPSDVDGMLRGSSGRRARVAPLSPESKFDDRLVIAGCDPAMSVLAAMVAKRGGVELIPASCSSLRALELVRQGKVHLAGSHLVDRQTGQANVTVLKKFFPKGGYRLVTYANWEQGLIVRKGNPKKIRSAGDLARKGVTIVNRERGAGSRYLLDRLLKEGGIEAFRVSGYNRIAYGHLPAAWHVFAGTADCSIGTRAAAAFFGLDFLPLQAERYDLVIPAKFMKFPAIEMLLDLLNRAELRHKLATLASYDTSHTGEVLV